MIGLYLYPIAPTGYDFELSARKKTTNFYTCLQEKMLEHSQ